MARPNKGERKQRVQEWAAAERAALVASMPLSSAQLDSLLDYLDANLRECDRTNRLTQIFLHVEQLDRDRVLSWLAEQGGYCDCEVLLNLRDLADSFHKKPAPPQPQPKARRPPRDLDTRTGWDLARLPKPWRVANLYAPDEPLKIQLGKKGGCMIMLVESSMPPGDTSSDDYWAQLWYARTELPERAPIVVSDDALDLPGGFRSTIVSTSGWLPVLCWIVPDEENWHLEVHTDLNRKAGDLPQVAKLITHLHMNKAGL